MCYPQVKMSPVFQSRNVPAPRGGDISCVFALTIVSPRVIRRRFGGRTRQALIEILGENDVGLFGLLVKDIVGQGFALVKQSNVVECIDTDRDAGFTQGITGTLGLDLVDDLVELDSQVF